MSKVVVIFEGKRIENLSLLGAKQFVKQNPCAKIEGFETVQPITVKKKEEAVAEVDVKETVEEVSEQPKEETAKRTRTRKPIVETNLDKQ